MSRFTVSLVGLVALVGCASEELPMGDDGFGGSTGSGSLTAAAGTVVASTGGAASGGASSGASSTVAGRSSAGGASVVTSGGAVAVGGATGIARRCDWIQVCAEEPGECLAASQTNGDCSGGTFSCGDKSGFTVNNLAFPCITTPSGVDCASAMLAYSTTLGTCLNATGGATGAGGASTGGQAGKARCPAPSGSDTETCFEMGESYFCAINGPVPQCVRCIPGRISCPANPYACDVDATNSSSCGSCLVKCSSDQKCVRNPNTVDGYYCVKSS